MARTYEEECSYLEPVSSCSFRIKKGFVPNMNVRLLNISPFVPAHSTGVCVVLSVVVVHILLSQVEGLFYVNSFLKDLMYDELKHHCASKGRRYCGVVCINSRLLLKFQLRIKHAVMHIVTMVCN